MKVEGFIFVGIAVFFAIVDLVYWYTSQDPTGTTALALAVGLAFLVGFYLLVTARRMEPRPEDRPDAEVAEGAGEFGFFSPHSWWPLYTAGSAAIMFLGIVFAWWLTIVGFLLLALSATGFVFEYYRGVYEP